MGVGGVDRRPVRASGAWVMLHALAAVALCLFIGERLVRYWSAWRLRRDERRYLAMLYPPPAPPVLEQTPRREWSMPEWARLPSSPSLALLSVGAALRYFYPGHSSKAAAVAAG